MLRSPGVRKDVPGIENSIRMSDKDFICSGWCRQRQPAANNLLFERRVIGRTHHVNLGGQRYEILRSQFGPLGVGIEQGPSCVSGRPILIREEINQRVRISEVLPYGHDVHATLLKY